MKQPKPIDQCHTPNDFLLRAKAQGAHTRNGHGSHVVVSTAKGSCPVSLHGKGNAPLPKGTQGALRRQFIALGQGVLALLIALMVVI